MAVLDRCGFSAVQDIILEGRPGIAYRRTLVAAD